MIKIGVIQRIKIELYNKVIYITALGSQGRLSENDISCDSDKEQRE